MTLKNDTKAITLAIQYKEVLQYIAINGRANTAKKYHITYTNLCAWLLYTVPILVKLDTSLDNNNNINITLEKLLHELY